MRCFRTLLPGFVALLAGAAVQAAPLLTQQSELELPGLGPGTARVSLTVDGQAFTRRFTWSLAVERAGTSLLSVVRDDAWLDRFFADDGYMQECSGYDQCKQAWYFERLPAALKGAIRWHDPAVDLLEPWMLQRLPKQALPFLQSRGLDAARRQAVVAEMLRLAQQGFLSITVPLSPLQDEKWMYVPSLGYFVPWWED